MATRFSSWDSYFWEPGGSVLRNLYDERDGIALAQREYSETNAQQFDIARGAVEIPRTHDADHLKAIHKQLFGNVYEWAGEYRTVGIHKGHTDFASLIEIPEYLGEASKIIGAADWSAMDRDQFAATAANVFAHVNQAHPFREGNGRASKLFMQQVAELSPFRIDYSPAVSGVTPEKWNQASMLSGPDLGSYAPVPDSLVPVFRALAIERAAGNSASVPAPGAERSARRASYPKSAAEVLRSPSPAAQQLPDPGRSSMPGPVPERGAGRGD